MVYLHPLEKETQRSRSHVGGMQTPARPLIDMGPEGTSDVWPRRLQSLLPSTAGVAPEERTSVALPPPPLRQHTGPTEGGPRPVPGPPISTRPSTRARSRGRPSGARGRSVSLEREPEAGLGWKGWGGAQGPMRPPASRRWWAPTVPGCVLALVAGAARAPR